MLWGAVALQIQIKFVALVLKNIKLGGHRELREFVKQLARELNDRELYMKFQPVEKLHVNFYDEVIEPHDFQLYMEEAQKLIERLEELLQERSK